MKVRPDSGGDPWRGVYLRPGRHDGVNDDEDENCGLRENRIANAFYHGDYGIQARPILHSDQMSFADMRDDHPKPFVHHELADQQNWNANQ